MLYRIQSIYLLIAFISLTVLTFGVDVFSSKVSYDKEFELISHANVFGVQRDLIVKEDLSVENTQVLRETLDKVDVDENITKLSTYKFPFYLITALMVLLTVAVTFNYKKLKSQLSLGRLLVVFNLLLFGVTLFTYYKFRNYSDILSKGDTAIYLGLGFYLICLSVAFSILALINIKRDYKLIQSIDRIR